MAEPRGLTSTSFTNSAVEGALEPVASCASTGPTRSRGRSNGSEVNVTTSGRSSIAVSSGHSCKNANGSVTVDGTRFEGSCTHAALVVVALGSDASLPPSASAAARSAAPG